MVKFSEKERKVITEICGKEYVQRYEGLLKREGEQVVKIVNTGMVSSGKSSLFNVLVDSVEKEYFPTGAARTTTVADYFDYKNISFVDTPGIDVRSEDDALAFSTIMEADLILMVHNIRTGSINRSESEWLEKIVKKMNDTEMCKARLLFVCTWKDTREKDADYSQILDDVQQQVFGIVGTEIPFFDVSVKKYMTGVVKEKEALKKSSGIIALKRYLETYAAQYLEKKAQINEEEMNYLASQMRSQLLIRQDSCNKQLAKIRADIGEKSNVRRKAWWQVYDLFAAKKGQLATLEKEYNEI